MPAYTLCLARAKKPTSVEEDALALNVQPLYISAPAPMPAREFARMKMYWAQNLNIEQAEFTAYDILGVPVSVKNDFSLQNINAFSSELIWNAKNLPEGVYMIRCRLGSSHTSKAVVVQ